MKEPTMMSDRIAKIQEAAWARVKELAPYLSDGEFRYLRENNKSETFKTFMKGYEFAQVDVLLDELEKIKKANPDAWDNVWLREKIELLEKERNQLNERILKYEKDEEEWEAAKGSAIRRLSVRVEKLEEALKTIYKMFSFLSSGIARDVARICVEALGRSPGAPK
jgi:hypothetical protein